MPNFLCEDNKIEGVCVALKINIKIMQQFSRAVNSKSSGCGVWQQPSNLTALEAVLFVKSTRDAKRKLPILDGLLILLLY